MPLTLHLQSTNVFIMTPNDLNQIKSLLQNQNEGMKKHIDTKLDETKEEINTKLDETIEEVNTKLDATKKYFDVKLDKTKEEIIRGVAEFVADTLNPMFDNHETRLEHLESHTTHPPGQPTSV